MRVLGIDPGSRHAGYGIIDIQGRKLKYVTSGVLRYDKTPNFIDRLGEIYRTCHGLLLEHKPQEVALEGLIYVKSVTSLSKLAQARGAMIAAYSESLSGSIFEYSPNLIKSSVTGHGHAEKEAVAKALGMILGVQSFRTYDESDALAVAVCHALNRGLKKEQHSKAKRRPKGGSSLKKALSHLGS